MSLQTALKGHDPAIVQPSDQLRSRTRDLTHLFALDANAKDRLAGVLKFATHHTGSPIAVIALQDRTGQWYNASLGLHLTSPCVHQLFCAHAVRTSSPLELASASDVAAHLYRDADDLNPVDGRFIEQQIRSYFGTPLALPQGELVGTLAIMAPAEQPVSDESKRMIAALAQQVVRLLNDAELRPIDRRALGEFDYPSSGFTGNATGKQECLLETLDSYLEEAHRHEEPARVAALFVDLDSFKLIHQTLGPTATNRLAAELVDRLRAGIIPGDEVTQSSLTVLSDLAPETIRRIAVDLLTQVTHLTDLTSSRTTDIPLDAGRS